MTWFRCGGSGIPAALKSQMNAVLNKKFGTAIDYPPNGWPDDVNLMGPLPEKTIVSWPVADFSDGADDVPTKAVQISIPPTLSGVSAVSEKQIHSRNMASMSDADFTLNGVRYYTENGVLYIDGTSTGETSSNVNAFKALDFWLPSGTYFFDRGNLLDLNVATYLRKYDDKSQIKTNTGSFTLTENTHLYISFYVYNKVFSNVKATIYINLGSTAIPYEDTAPITQYTASLGRTIHGGTADLVTGEGTETHKGYTLDNLTWSGGIVGGADWCWYVDLSADGLKLPTNSEIFSGICDNYTPIRYNGVATNQNTIALRSNGFLYVNNGSDTTEPTGKVTIELATGTDFTFTGQEIDTMLGYNAFWSDQGDTKVTYRADISLALQAVSGSRGLMMASRPAIEPSNGDQASEESTENNIETEGEQDAR